MDDDDAVVLKKNKFPLTINYLKGFENVYLRRLKITPILGYNSRVQLEIFKNNVPLSYGNTGGANWH